jgi:hypothetical protein
MLSRHDGGSRTVSLTAIPSLRPSRIEENRPPILAVGMWHENAISHPPREVELG